MTLEWLFHSYQRNLLKALFESPVEGVHINELARRAGVDPGNTKRYLEKFALCGVVNLKKRGRTIEALPALENPETRKIFELFELEKTKVFLDNNGLIGQRLNDTGSCLVNALPDIRLVSIQANTAAVLEPGDDINMTVIVGSGYNTETVFQQVQLAVAKCCERLPIILNVQNTTAIDAAWEFGDSEARSLWTNRIILYGEGYFWKLAARRGEPITADIFPEKVVQHA
jgi:hypothetical protein